MDTRSASLLRRRRLATSTKQSGGLSLQILLIPLILLLSHSYLNQII
ncbi:hypothetical protein SORBI_3008G066501 [Sorghum bicolor]|uniref:Uncharacterized protein n=1 Tax=Sorghum bicolor TaxID=4558 RepID=A0A1Z5R520_SORBI|nr:hypothetical protein SORBI_3008G066501 [Sorghum bicolor]